MIFRPWLWSRRVERWFGRVPGMDAPKLARHRRRLEQGESVLWAGFSGRRMVMAAIISTVEGPKGPELLLELAAGDLPAADLTRAGAAAAELLAAKTGCVAVRFATVRPGLARKTVMWGYTLCEVVMRKEIAA